MVSDWPPGDGFVTPAEALALWMNADLDADDAARRIWRRARDGELQAVCRRLVLRRDNGGEVGSESIYEGRVDIRPNWWAGAMLSRLPAASNKFWQSGDCSILAAVGSGGSIDELAHYAFYEVRFSCRGLGVAEREHVSPADPSETGRCSQPAPKQIGRPKGPGRLVASDRQCFVRMHVCLRVGRRTPRLTLRGSLLLKLVAGAPLTASGIGCARATPSGCRVIDRKRLQSLDFSQFCSSESVFLHFAPKSDGSGFDKVPSSAAGCG
jgi:hypothetical protein